MDPVTVALISAAVAEAAKGGGEYFKGQSAERLAKRRAKESKRETLANLMNEGMQGEAELETHRLSGRDKLGKRRTQGMQGTADLVRGAFNI